MDSDFPSVGFGVLKRKSPTLSICRGELGFLVGMLVENDRLENSKELSSDLKVIIFFKFLKLRDYLLQI
jgi:hypothetical protein